MSKQDLNENAMSSLDYAPLDEINKDYGDHNGLIAIDENNYNHDGLVDLNGFLVEIGAFLLAVGRRRRQGSADLCRPQLRRSPDPRWC